MAAKLPTSGAGDLGGRFVRLLGGTGATDRPVLAGLWRDEGRFSAGIAAIADHGTVTDTGAADQAMAAIGPELAGPPHPDGGAKRFHHLTAAPELHLNFSISFKNNYLPP